MTHKPRGRADPSVAVFFYGSFMDRAVLRRRGYDPGDVEVARLPGFDLRFAPLATVVRSDESRGVYGIVASATRDELERLYSEGWLSSYHAETVTVETAAGRRVPALVYIASGPTPPAPSDDYIDHILGPAREYGFPGWYLEHLENRWREREGDTRAS